MHKHPWPPLYPNIKAFPSVRVQADVLLDDHRAICGVAANTGIVTYLIQQTFKLTADYVRTHNLSHLNSEEFIEYIRQRSFTGAPQATAAPDVTGRAERIRNAAKNVKDKSAKSRKEVADGQRGEGE